MNRTQEIDLKHERLGELMRRHGADGLLLTRVSTIAWFTAGADAAINTATDSAAYRILVTPDRRVVVTDPIESTRIRAEDRLQEHGFDFDITPWHAPDPSTTANMLVEDAVEAEIQSLRWVLLPPEQVRLRAVAADTAAAVEEAARAVQPGDSEFDIAARLDAACRRRGGNAIVNLVASDERISSFRHPLPSGKRMERYGMLVVCMRREGLVVSATRLVHAGPVPSELADKARRVATIDARVMAATRPGRTLGQVFDDLLAAYAAVGESDQWTLHHQGGIAGYAPRERIAVPGDPTVVQAGQVYAWNPSVVGCKSEDTMLVSDDGFDIVSAAGPGWPSFDIDVDGQVVRRPGILEL